ncbi:MAG: hypothetical protein P0Y56_14460 [Candidatus Andeanibacterium colombiense]|uniref:Uncharacterized protein n=1 Tax=Candidatus Andeanibacterium colombiense TaxID=3121345 RepID=A0AAJ5X7U9_9SPHN|nr:MAG: hypothetical protein P0Y56_14460 [Sphingomonadaceae bacterium]
MMLKRFVGGLMLVIAMICAVPLAAKTAQPGLFLRNGQAFIFRLEAGQPVDIRPAGKDEKPRKGELKVELVDNFGSTLTVTSEASEQLNYEAWIAKDEYANGSRTKVCTLVPGQPGFENWPDSLTGLRLTNFEPAGDSFGCS